jgi:hypothetical protein
MSVLLRISSQLISASAKLLTEGRPYAGAALLRQIVEIEYLAWAFESRDKDAERWLRSDREFARDFSDLQSCETHRMASFGARTMDSTANLADILFPLAPCCLAWERV